LLNINDPPGALNWSIGSTGAVQTGSTGTYDATGTPVKPKSLYLQQLGERLGPQAAAAIGY
jgi:hypothetical protein